VSGPTPLLRFKGGGVSDSATTTPDVIAIPANVRGYYLFADAAFRIDHTSSATVLVPDATNMGYAPAGGYTQYRHPGGTHIQIAAVTGTVVYTIGWLQ